MEIAFAGLPAVGMKLAFVGLPAMELSVFGLPASDGGYALLGGAPSTQKNGRGQGRADRPKQMSQLG